MKVDFLAGKWSYRLTRSLRPVILVFSKISFVLDTPLNWCQSFFWSFDGAFLISLPSPLCRTTHHCQPLDRWQWGGSAWFNSNPFLVSSWNHHSFSFWDWSVHFFHSLHYNCISSWWLCSLRIKKRIVQKRHVNLQNYHSTIHRNRAPPKDLNLITLLVISWS